MTTDLLYPTRAQNFRAIAALPAGDGRSLRANTLYRTGDMSTLREDCVDRLAQLGIRAVVDLRSASERRVRPYAWLDAIDADAWNDKCEHSPAAINVLMNRQERTADDVAAAMRDLYREIAFTYAESFGELYRRIIAGRTPLIFGCAAGKDRTGVAAALLLWQLGVSRDDIIADYLETNAAIGGLERMIQTIYGWDPGAPKTRAVLVADATYLDALFDEVNTRFGGVERYFSDQLGIDAAGRKALADQLLD